MSSRPSQNNPKLIRMIFLFLLIGAVSIPVSAADGPIAVFLSADEETYKRPVEAFVSELKMPTVTFNLEGDIKRRDEVMSKMMADKPSLIFALGAKAAYVAKVWTLKKNRQDVPIVFTMVINWERYNLLDGSDNISGVSIDIDPGTQFANMQMFAPNVKTVGVVYSKEHSGNILDRAQMITAMLGLELMAQPIEADKEFRNAFEKMEDNIGAYWILTDPVIFTTRNMDWLKKSCVSKRIVSIGQSKNVAKLGVVLTVNIDPHNIGVQAASIARDILSGNQKPKDIGVMAPLGTSLILNTNTAAKIGLDIPEELKGMAAEIIEDED